MKKILYVGMLVLCFGLLSGCSKRSKDKKTEVYVFLAASLSNAMDELKDKYMETHPDISIIYNTDSSGALKTQIEEGAKCDLFFSAATKQMDALMKEGYIKEDSIVNLLENKVVLIKSKNLDTKVTGFDNITLAKSIALANKDVPVGSYAREIFESMGIFEEVMAMEINECANVSVVLAAVMEASNEVGITYATDAYSKLDKVEIIAEAPIQYLQTPVIYPVGVVKNSEARKEQTEAVNEFLDYITSDEATKIFQKYLFSIYEE